MKGPMEGTAKPLKWTYEDYLAFPDDGKRYEIIEGEKFVTPAPIPKHQWVALNLVKAFNFFLERNPVGAVLFSPIDVLLSEETVVQPDIVFIQSERLGIVGDKAITAAPDFIIEILSDSSRRTDYVPKRKLYAKHGVREYWIVDPAVERVEIFVQESGDLVKKAEHTTGDVSSLEVLPGFSVAIRAIFDWGAIA